MQITFDTSTATAQEYDALMALIGVMAGRVTVADEEARTIPAEAEPKSNMSEREREEGVGAAQDTDASGLPWDERIHSSNRKTIADGTWQKKRGVDAQLVASVEAELRGEEIPADEPIAAMTAEAAFSAPPPPPPVETAGPISGYTPDIAGFTKLMTTLTQKQSAGEVAPTAELLPVLQGLGLPEGFPGLMKPDNLKLIPTVAATLGF